MKTLRICLSKELPGVELRDPNYMYLTYDKLDFYIGRNQYYDPFIICETMPDAPIPGYVYIQLNGVVRTLIKDEPEDLAVIEDQSQVQILKDMGTTYFTHADRRYLDRRSRTLQLPFNNGTYNMTVSMMRDLRVDDQTFVRFDQETQTFYIEGEHNVPHFRGYNGMNTDTVDVEVNDHCIHANVKISQEAGNILRKIRSGLFASVDNKISLEEFNQLRAICMEYKDDSDALLRMINDELQSMRDMLPNPEDVIDKDSILAMIKEALLKYNDDILNIIEYYNEIAKQVEEVRKQSIQYTDKVFDDKIKEIKKFIEDSLGDIWGHF